jgi:hypothetical protein
MTTINHPHDLLTTLAKMKSAKAQGVNMAVWDSEIKAVEDAISTIEEITKEMQRGHDLRATLEVQSMKAMDQLRAQIRSLGAEPLL